MRANPIILKELLQAARHRRTYAIRAALPALAGLVLAVEVLRQAERGPLSWREVAAFTRALFNTLAWLELVVLSVLAYITAQNCVAAEWTNRTMEVLSATPLGGRPMFAGKFLGTLGKALFSWLSLLPFMAILFHLGHVPWEVGLGSMGVIVGSVLLAEALGFLHACRSPDRKRRLPRLVWFFWLLYLGWPVLLLLGPLVMFWPLVLGVLAPLVPPLALARVLSGTGWWGPVGPGLLAFLSFTVAALVSAWLLATAEGRFRRSFEVRLTAARKPQVPADVLKDVGVLRPPMGAQEDPFVWQEKLPRANVPWVSAVLCIVAVFWLLCVGFQTGNELRQTFPLSAFLAVGLVSALAPAVYGAAFFAREKAGRTAQALLLAGNSPERLLRSKVKALYWLLRWPLIIVGVSVCLMVLVFARLDLFANGELVLWLFLLLETLLLGPALAGLAGMVFGVVAGSPVRALGALLASALWCFLGIEAVDFFGQAALLGASFILWALAAAWLVVVRARRPETWNCWHLSGLLGLGLWALWSYAFLLRGVAAVEGTLLAALLFVGANVLTLGATAVWRRLALRSFDLGLAGEAGEGVWAG